MRVRAEDELIEPERNEGHTADYVRSIGESPNPM